MKEITVKISNSNFEKLKRATQKDRIVNVALKQFFQKNHKIKVRMSLKRGYKRFGNLNLRLSKVLEKDSFF